MLKARIIFCFSLLVIFHHVFAQDENNKTYIPSGKYLTYKTFMEDFSNQSGLFFSYGEEIISLNAVINFKKSKYTLNEALAYAFFYTDINYSLHKNVIILNKARQCTIEGRFVDSLDGFPIAYATVMVDGMNKGVISDENGYYNMRLKEGSYVLNYLCFGYYPVGEKITISMDSISHTVRLTPAIHEMETVYISRQPKFSNIDNIESVLDRGYVQRSSPEEIFFLLFPGFVTLKNGNVVEGIIRITPNTYVKKIQFKCGDKKPIWLKTDSLKSFTQDRTSFYKNFSRPDFSVQFQYLDSSGKNHYGFFPKLKNLPIQFSKVNYNSSLSKGDYDTVFFDQSAYQDFDKYISLTMGGINPYYLTYEALSIKKSKKVFLPRIIYGTISLYKNPRNTNSSSSAFDYIQDFQLPSIINIPLQRIASELSLRKMNRNKMILRSSYNETNLINNNSYFVKKNGEVIKIKSTNYKKYFPLLFNDSPELIEFVREREDLKKYKNMFKLIILYNYLHM